MASVALLGAGLLGSGFAENLLAKGHSLRVWNRTASKLAPLVQKGAQLAGSAAEAVAGVERVHLVLAEDDAVEAVLAAMSPGLAPQTPIFDHSTNLPARVAERVPRLRAQGLRYVHAPVFMSPNDARNATGLMLFAGPTSEFEAAKQALSSMTGKLWHVGERPDLAAAYKLFGNAFLLSVAGTMGDILAMGDNMGIGPDGVAALFETFRPSPAFLASRVAQRGQAPASFELSMARKDVRLMIEAAGGPEGLVTLPAVAAAMDAAIERGEAERDFAVYAWPRPLR